jgi:hypothetical protein
MTEVVSKSQRNLIADRIAHFIVVNGLNRPFGGDVSLYRGGKVPCYTVAFSLPRILDGTVSVYSATFVQVRFQTAIRLLPNAGSFVFKSEPDAINFLRLAFVENKYEEALDFANSTKVTK